MSKGESILLDSELAWKKACATNNPMRFTTIKLKSPTGDVTSRSILDCCSDYCSKNAGILSAQAQDKSRNCFKYLGDLAGKLMPTRHLDQKGMSKSTLSFPWTLSSSVSPRTTPSPKSSSQIRRWRSPTTRTSTSTQKRPSPSLLLRLRTLLRKSRRRRSRGEERQQHCRLHRLRRLLLLPMRHLQQGVKRHRTLKWLGVMDRTIAGAI